MNHQQIADLLVARARQESLAPFYIVHGHPHLPSAELFQWMNRLLCQLLQEERRPTAGDLSAHQDMDTLVLHSEEKQYKTPQVDAILKQLEYGSFTGKRRYWVIQEAHKCTPIITNKLLKTLEEPPPDTTIFLLNPRATAMAPTVLGRAVVLRLTLPPNFAPPNAQGISFTQFLQRHFAELAKIWNPQLSVGELAQKIHSAQASGPFIQAAQSWCQAQLTGFQQCQQFLELAQLIQGQREFHGRPQTQLALVIRQVTDLCNIYSV